MSTYSLYKTQLQSHCKRQRQDVYKKFQILVESIQ
jgi:hypothetical protein